MSSSLPTEWCSGGRQRQRKRGLVPRCLGQLGFLFFFSLDCRDYGAKTQGPECSAVHIPSAPQSSRSGVPRGWNAVAVLRHAATLPSTHTCVSPEGPCPVLADRELQVQKVELPYTGYSWFVCLLLVRSNVYPLLERGCKNSCFVTQARGLVLHGWCT